MATKDKNPLTENEAVVIETASRQLTNLMAWVTAPLCVAIASGQSDLAIPLLVSGIALVVVAIIKFLPNFVASTKTVAQSAKTAAKNATVYAFKPKNTV